MSPLIKRILGTALVILGLIGLVAPIIPGLWLLFIGLGLLGIHIVFLDQTVEYFQKQLARASAHKQTLARFARYLSVGVSTFVLDLGMLYVAVNFLGIPYYLATPGAFLIAVTCNYFISRPFVFKGSTRAWHHGYAYFILLAIAGAAATTVLVAALVSYAHMFYIVARILVAGIIGMVNYLVNLHHNFKVAGKHTASL